MGTSFRSLLLLGLGLTAGLASAQTPSCEKTEKIYNFINYGFKITGLDENSQLSGTKVEFTIEIRYFEDRIPPPPPVQVMDARAANVEVKIGDEVVKSLPGEGTIIHGGPKWKFRFSSLKWPHGTTVPITLKARFRLRLSGSGPGSIVDEYHDFTGTLSCPTYNKLWESLTPDFPSIADDFHSKIVSGSAFPHHLRQPDSASAAQSHTKSTMQDNVLDGTAYWFMLHGDPQYINPPHDMQGQVKLYHVGTGSVESSRLAKTMQPPVCSVAAFSCKTLATGTNAVQGWGIGGINQSYFGYRADVATSATTLTNWRAYAGQRDSVIWHDGDAIFVPDAKISDIAASLANLLTTSGIRVGEALAQVNQNYLAITSSDTLDGGINIAVLPLELGGTDALATLRYVYLEQELVSSFQNQNKSTAVYWIELPMN